MTRRGLAELGIVVAVLAGVGALAGVVWERVWTPTVGIVFGHGWSAGDALGLQQQFSGTGWYVVVGFVAGLLAGALVAVVLDRAPLLTFVGVVVGSVLGAWLMLEVGMALGPPDPQVLAKTADDGTRLAGNLEVSGHSPWIAYPAGALISMTVVFIGFAPRHRMNVDVTG